MYLDDDKHKIWKMNMYIVEITKVLRGFQLNPPKTCYNVDTRMDDIQRSSSPKSKMACSYRSRCMCCVLETNLTRKFAADLSLLIW